MRTLLGVLVLAATLAATSDVHAQQNWEDRAARMAAETDSLIARMGLEAEKEFAVRAILGDRNEKMVELIRNRPRGGNPRTLREAIMAKRNEIDQEAQAALGALLSEEQMTVYQEWISRQQPRQRRPGNRQGQGRRRGGS